MVVNACVMVVVDVCDGGGGMCGGGECIYMCDGGGGCGVLHVLNVCPRGLFKMFAGTPRGP